MAAARGTTLPEMVVADTETEDTTAMLRPDEVWRVEPDKEEAEAAEADEKMADASVEVEVEAGVVEVGVGVGDEVVVGSWVVVGGV